MSFLLARHARLPAYVPGDHVEGDGFIRLNTNESPYPPSPGVAQAVAREAAQLGYYNDPDCTAIRRALAERYGVQMENVTVAGGSDELLYFAFMAFADEAHPIFLPDVTYNYYDLFAAALGIPLQRVPLLPDFTVSPDDYLRRGGMIVLANPNAPTGYALALSDVERIVAGNPDSVVLIDEAYVDFGGESALQLIARYENLLVVRTFSKSRSLAGARLGYGFGSARIIADIERIRNAVNLYAVSRMTQAAGVAALAEDAYYMENCRRIIDTRETTARRLRALGFEVLASQTNFLFVRPHWISGKALKDALQARRILVRRWDAPRVSEYLRISIGTAQEMDALIEAIGEIRG